MVSPNPNRIRERIAKVIGVKERAAVHAAEVILSLPDVVGGFRVSRGLDTIEFDAPPQLINDRLGNVVGVDALIRVFRGGIEQQVDPHRIAVNPPCLVPDGTFITVIDPVTGLLRDMPNFREDPREAYFSWLFETVLEQPNPAGWRTKGTTSTFWSSTADGYLDSATTSPAPYSDAREGLGSIGVNTTSGVAEIGQRVFFGDFHCGESFFSFDTSTLGDTDTINAVALALRGSTDSSTTDFTIQARTKDWGASLTTADYVAGSGLSALTLLATFATSGFSTAGYNTFTENGTNFRTAINKTGTTYVMCSSDRHSAATEPTGDEYVNVATADDGGAGTTNDPKLTITHTAAAVDKYRTPILVRQAIQRASTR